MAMAESQSNSQSDEVNEFSDDWIDLGDIEFNASDAEGKQSGAEDKQSDVEQKQSLENSDVAKSNNWQVEIAETPRRKSWQEKAAEKGYVKNEKGVWMDGGDDDDDFGGWPEPVPGFKLDEEYPDLADKTEDLAAKFGNNYDDGVSGFKSAVYEHAKEVSQMSDNHLEMLFAVQSFIGNTSSRTAESLFSRSEVELDRISTLIANLNYDTKDAQGDPQIARSVRKTAESVLNNYYPQLEHGDIRASLAKHAEAGHSSLIDSTLFGCMLNESDGAYIGDYLDCLGDASEASKDSKLDRLKYEALRLYSAGHGVDERTVKGFNEVVFPLMEANDRNVESLMEISNNFGTVAGAYGIADYTIECLISKYEPGEINKMLRVYSEIPTSDFAKFEQNRMDASHLQGTIIGGRDFIHDERIGTHETLAAMLDYYNHKDDEDAAKYQARLQELEDQYGFGILPNALDLDRYDKPVNTKKITDSDETAIDILRRLVKNTEAVPLETPETDDKELNDLLAEIHPLISEKSGAVRVDIGEIGPAITRLNQIITENRGKQGIMPSTVSAIAYLDKLSAYALRDCSKSELPELPFDPHFKEIVRFSQLTSSTSYSEREFEEHYNEILANSGGAYEDDQIDTRLTNEAYRTLHQWIVGNSNALASQYNKKDVTKRFSSAVWSGNLSDELIGLFERV